MNIWIRGGRLIDPEQQLDKTLDLFVQEGHVVALGTAPAGFHADSTIDANGCLVLPGFIDLNGRLHKATGSGPVKALEAALAAGVTTLLCPPDSSQQKLDSSAAVSSLMRAASRAVGPRLLPSAALTMDLAGERLADFASLRSSGCISVGQGNHEVNDFNMLRRGFAYAASHDLLLVMQPHDQQLAAAGLVHEGAVSSRLGLKGVPAIAEAVAVDVLTQLAELTGARLHLSRLTSAAGVERLQAAQARGLSVTADVSIANLLFTDKQLTGFDSHFLVTPPLRAEGDRQALLNALREGVITAICSNHHAQHADSKLAPLPHAEPGLSVYPQLVDALAWLVATEGFSWLQLSELLSLAPAKILGLQSASIGIGCRADLTIIKEADDGVDDNDQPLSASAKPGVFASVVSTLLAGRPLFDLNIT